MVDELIYSRGYVPWCDGLESSILQEFAWADVRELSRANDPKFEHTIQAPIATKTSQT